MEQRSISALYIDIYQYRCPIVPAFFVCHEGVFPIHEALFGHEIRHTAYYQHQAIQ